MKLFNQIIGGIGLGIVVAFLLSFAAFSLSMFRQGAESIGAGPVTIAYFLACICISTAMLVVSPAARKRWMLMGFFVATGFAVMAIGLNELFEASTPQRTGQLGAINLDLKEITKQIAIAVLYGGPGALTAFYVCQAAFGSKATTAVASR